MENAKEQLTPMSTLIKHDVDKRGKSVDIKYRSTIGELLYLMTSRHDIMFSVCICARFQANTKKLHLTIIKRMLRYHKDSLNIGLW